MTQRRGEPELTDERQLDADVIVVGGGPAGSALGTLLAMDGVKTIILEKDVHPRDHVGESLVPSTNLIFKRLNFLDKMNDAGFIHKPGAAWNGPRSPLWKFVEVPLFEYPIEGGPQPYTYNVERDAMDAMLIRHAHENGAKVLQGVKVRHVIFEDGRAVGVRVQVADGWERDVYAKYVVDASGRRCLLANQLKMKHNDPTFNQFCIYSWFEGVKLPPERLAGYSLFYFLGLNQAWGWQFPLRQGKSTIGIVLDKEDFQKSGKDPEEFFFSLVDLNDTFRHAMSEATRIRPFWVEGDYSYKIDRFAGPGWLLAGDALRFVDPIFSSGVDVALYSGLHAYETLIEVMQNGNEEEAFDAYHKRVEDGADIWYDMIAMFYRLQNLVTKYVSSPHTREMFVRALQGNPYDLKAQARSRALLDLMQESYDRVMQIPGNLMRPWAMDPEKYNTLTCPTCLGVADYWPEEEAFVCRRCGAKAPAVSMSGVATEAVQTR
jgi:flavin-dependent dehydrogenase